MQMSLVRLWSYVKEFTNIDLNSEFQNIRQWWNDHDSGARTWNNVNVTNLKLPGGVIRQFAYTTTASASTTTANTFQATNLAITFTTLVDNSTVYVFVTGDASVAAANVNLFLTVERGTTNLASSTSGFTTLLAQGAGTTRMPIAMIAKDVPGTAGAYVYKVFIRNSDGATSVSFPSANAPDAAMFIIEVS